MVFMGAYYLQWGYDMYVRFSTDIGLAVKKFHLFPELLFVIVYVILFDCLSYRKKLLCYLT